MDEQKARYEYDRALADLVLEDSPDLVVCAGWMHSKRGPSSTISLPPTKETAVLAPSFLNPLAEAGIEIINLHPALPGVSCQSLITYEHIY